ncbi:hypothetical protein EV702DRAFT_1088255 [Suillus placidus]|uniref:Uncharacterized protein n=1 Tax=Suillus placidus TaxID=48579 RepID=A0A9P6ZZ16_9AGAM|nr:hypothetical protein EV702DRAFT_1088255 [Suillus placidus]
MRFSCAIILAVVAVLASSISATPVDNGVEYCPVFCYWFTQCYDCWLRHESESCHIGAVWFMALTRELVVVGC